jgi:hypothetical protein
VAETAAKAGGIDISRVSSDTVEVAVVEAFVDDDVVTVAMLVQPVVVNVEDVPVVVTALSLTDLTL